jgi:fatty acid desaturase
MSLFKFRYAQDRLPVALIVALFVLDLAVFLFVQNIWLVTAWMLLGLGPKACICSWNHHHQHLSTFMHWLPNRLLELVYAFHTGITSNAWVLHHVLGHHVNYLDQAKDESGWKRKDGTVMGVVEYTWNVALTGYWRAHKVAQKYLQHGPVFYGMGFLVAALLVCMAFYSWVNTVIVFMIPMLIGYIITVWHTYYHHAGLDTSDAHEASYNIMHKWYNRLTGNLGYHTAHHMKMGLHWSKLPEYHAEIEANIPAQNFVEPCIPFKWMSSK